MIIASRTDLFLWSPFLLSIGIIIFFETSFYPQLPHLILTFTALGAKVFLAYKKRKVRIIVLASCIILAGFAISEIRTIISYTEMLTFPQYLQKETGIVKSFSRRKVGALLTIEHQKSLIKVYSTKNLIALNLGDIVEFSAYIEPSKGSVTPSGYDFAMFDYFNGIRGTGRIIGAVKVIQPTEHYSLLTRIREIIYEKFKYYLPEIPSEIALALTIGKKDGIKAEISEIFRKSGTSHLLAISGLHMGLIGLFFFSLFRRCLALSEYLTLNYNIKKLSILIGIASSIFYLQLSGMQISAQRACIMTCTFFLSILLDRKTDILRSITLAAVVLITLYPENIFKPGFQMSFFAVLGICSCTRKDTSLLKRKLHILPQVNNLESLAQVSEMKISERKNLAILREKALRIIHEISCYYRKLLTTPNHKLTFQSVIFICRKASKTLTYLIAIIRASILATTATTPFVLYHFHYFSMTGIISNAIAIPFTSFVIIPTLAGILMLMPLYNAQTLYTFLSLEIDILIRLMESFNRLNLGYLEVHGFSGVTLLILVTGTLLLLIVKTSIRYFGIVFIAAGALMIKLSPIPDIFISDKNVAIRSKDGNLYFLNTAKTPKNFTARNWLQYSGSKTKKIHTLNDKEVEKIEDSYVYKKNGKVILIGPIKSNTGRKDKNYDLLITQDSQTKKDEKTISIPKENKEKNSFVFVKKKRIKIVKAKNWPLGVKTQRQKNAFNGHSSFSHS